MVNIKFLLPIVLLNFSSSLVAQNADSARIFPKLIEQYNEERILTKNYYYNPANMSDYSSSSISEFRLNYTKEDKRAYRQQLGSGQNGFEIQTNSYKKLRNNSFVWGKAQYSNFNLKNIKWNEDLDFDRVAPYVLADSVGGDKKLEIYNFGGGYGKKSGKFGFGISGEYTAQMAYRNRDPRSKNTTSDLIINAGINYDIYKNLQIGAFAEFNKYTQNGNINFVSEVSKPLIYQMVGFGYSNYFFFSETASVMFEEFGYKFGGHISNKNGKDFYVRGMMKHSNNVKSIITKNSNTFYEASDLENKTYEIEGAKFFNFGDHRTGLLLNYASTIKTGLEYGYTNNTSIISEIYRRNSYRKEDYISTGKLFYQYKAENFNVAATPYLAYHETIERRIYPFSGQKYDALIVGIDAQFQKEIKENQVLTIQPTFSYRLTQDSTNALDLNQRDAFNQWILSDYNYLTSDVLTAGATLRYDIKLNKIPSLFIAGTWITQRILNQNNNYASASLGITF